MKYARLPLLLGTALAVACDHPMGIENEAPVRAANTAGPSALAPDALPDLGMDRLKDFSIERKRGRRLLRFSTTIVNVGAGAFELHGQRGSTGEPHMQVAQRIFDDQGGWRDVATAAETELGGDGHNHWHIRDLALSELHRLDDGGFLARIQKTGFCFWDNVAYRLDLPGAPGSPRYGESGCGDAGDLTVRMGLSIGWGDIYPAWLPDQYIDITGVPDGRYRLTVTADPANWFTEANDNNNVTWVDLEIDRKGRRVRVLGHGPAAMVASAGR